MLSSALPRGSLADIVLPGAPVRSTSASSRRLHTRDVALLLGGDGLVALCLWLSDRALTHQRVLLAGSLDAGARTLAGDILLTLAFLAVVALSAQPRAAGWARDAALIAGGTLLLALGARLTLPLPFTPVPITGQTFAVLLVAASLGWRRGFASVLFYVVLGTEGAPIFASSASPASYGYIAGFALAAVVVGWLAERGWDRRLPTAMLAMLAGEIAIYACGLPWLAQFTGWQSVVVLGFVPFIAGDAVKLVAAAVALPVAWKVTGKVTGRALGHGGAK